MHKAKVSSLVPFLLAGLVLLVTIGAGIAAWLPVVRCPKCHGTGGACELKDGTIFVVPYGNPLTTTGAGEIYWVVDDEGIRRVMRKGEFWKVSCPRCKGKDRVPLFQCWRRD